jgi:hypothetical protein
VIGKGGAKRSRKGEPQIGLARFVSLRSLRSLTAIQVSIPFALFVPFCGYSDFTFH